MDEIKNTKFLFEKIKKTYSAFEMPDEVDVMAWTEILDGYSQVEILDAFKNYRKEVIYNRIPSPAEFKRFLPEKQNNEFSQKVLKLADELGDKFGKEARDRYLSCYPQVDASGHFWKAPEVPSYDAQRAKPVTPESLMNDDIKADCCHHLLPMYRRAFNFVLNEILPQEISYSRWQQLDWAGRASAARQKGLFGGNFSQILEKICLELTGKDRQF